MSRRLGAWVKAGETHFAVRSPLASQVWLCLFADEKGGGAETRHAMRRDGEVWRLELPVDLTGGRYGLRAAGEWAPEHGFWFDPAKLLVDPYAQELDRRFVQHPSLAQYGADTAGIVPKAIIPKAIVPGPPRPVDTAPPDIRGGLIYEINVRGFTMLHPDVPEAQRGTVAALAQPAALAHLRKLHVTAVELMPIVAWIDERHLPPLGLRNAWGYNPVALMALDPGLCPGGVEELRETVAALHAEGIAVILDLVFNHTGESDTQGGVLSLRGLDDAAYAKGPDGALINDAGTGNTLDFANPWVRRLTLDAMRHFVSACGVDGFRFDLATVLARGPGFSPQAPIFGQIAADSLLANRILIAEPWDVGPGGYQLGAFPPHWLEWNDRFRDDVRRFWRGDGSIGALATGLAGSSDVFGADCRSINFLAAHDGFTLADMLAYAERHNHANGEDNRDGHGENVSWNNGVEGPSDDPAVLARRQAAVRALLSTLFASTGTVMLTAGDEFGRSQQGNNNAYAQDNPVTWVDWAGRDLALEDYVAGLARWRAERRRWFTQFPQAGQWLSRHGPMTVADWEAAGAGYVAYRSDDPARPYGFEVDREASSLQLR
ncbi:glycogen debranching protein GlgX [uncultured Novosphingobium sp.]|uniref:glycogen debranching protein GlgX n=1 Tax=uncultured Novosphingobium sp. TaxID=292277 RepID=UPI00258C81BC|nr:glycogen debranching protein GlgX [uncultured Novosphingobium sp.]